MRGLTSRMAEESAQTSTWLLTEGEAEEQHHDQHPHQEKSTLINNNTRKQKLWEFHPVETLMRVLGILTHLVCLLVILYFFICSLGLLEDAFTLLGGRAAGEAFSNSELLSNPIAGLMIGVLATVLVQSSSTVTSIVVAMVAAEVIPFHAAIPVIMGTNVGTSFTSTLVAFAQAGKREEFRRAFAGATVHDMFNWIAVIVLLPIEIVSGYLARLTGAIVDSLQLNTRNYEMEMLTTITRPFTSLIVEVNRDVITDIAMAPNATKEASVMKRWCHVTMTQNLVSVMRYDPIEVECRQVSRTSPFYASCTHKTLAGQASDGIISFFLGWNHTELVNVTLHRTRCNNLFALSDMGDKAAGVILLIVSIIVILLSLFGIVKILNSVMQGPMAKVIQKTMNADFPGKFGFLTGYFALLVGCGLTIVIQSSSVFTSTLTPLAGVGIVSLERVYPMTLGSNIGTTVTGILAALSVRGRHMGQALQIALCHLFFNVSAVLLFYPIPFMRFPISLAKILGRTTSKYRWFALVYLMGMFLVLPALIFGLSMAGWVYLAAIGGPIFLLFLIVVVINVLQRKRPSWLPRLLRSWECLPLFCRSCKPYDNILSCACIKNRLPRDDDDDDTNVDDDDGDHGGNDHVEDDVDNSDIRNKVKRNEKGLDPRVLLLKHTITIRDA